MRRISVLSRWLILGEGVLALPAGSFTWAGRAKKRTMAMAAHEDTKGGLWQRIQLAFDDTRTRWSLRTELARLEEVGELDVVLSDLGLSRAEVPVIVGIYRLWVVLV